jgi:hypothetical protein
MSLRLPTEDYNRLIATRTSQRMGGTLQLLWCASALWNTIYPGRTLFGKRSIHSSLCCTRSSKSPREEDWEEEGGYPYTPKRLPPGAYCTHYTAILKLYGGQLAGHDINLSSGRRNFRTQDVLKRGWHSFIWER